MVGRSLVAAEWWGVEGELGKEREEMLAGKVGREGVVGGGGVEGSSGKKGVDGSVGMDEEGYFGMEGGGGGGSGGGGVDRGKNGS